MDDTTGVTHEVALTVNGTPRRLRVEARRSLADVLRRDLALTGTTVGCEVGECGTCTVLVDGEAVRACLVLAVAADGADVETVESLSGDAHDAGLGPLQCAFADHRAVQCGFCTPGFLMLATGLLRSEPDACRDRVREHLDANLCRCGGYEAITDAVVSMTAAPAGEAS